MADAIEAFLSQLHHPMLASIDLSLDRMYRLLGALGSPHKRLPPVIHVAGTNGKGSLIACLQAIFEASGYRVHRYTSPHLVHFRERILLQGQPVDNARLEVILKHVASFLPGLPVTFFEATTAAAFLAFSERPADVLLLETGMGGRLDATNVIDKPLLTAITPVSFDHCEFLGNTLPAIAAEKAGILKRGIPCVVGKQENESLNVIEGEAARLAAPLYRYGREWQVQWQGGQAVYQSPKRTLPFTPALAGKYQYDNAATAIACIDQLANFTMTDTQIAQGIARAAWPARLQKLNGGRHAAILPEGMELWLDGGHNPQGGEMLAGWLSEQKDKEIYLVCGMIRGKDTAPYLKPMAPYIKALYSVAIPGETQSKPAEQVEMAARGLGIEAASAASVEKALQTIAQRAKTPSIICICGSLYLAGKVLAAD